MAGLFRAVTLFSALVFAGDHASAEVDTYVNSSFIAEIEVGVFCNVEVIGTDVAPDTDLGRVNVIGRAARHVSHSTTVPVVGRLFFGVRSRAANGQILNGVTFRNTHPPFVHNGTTTGSYGGRLTPDKFTHQLYAFDFDYEMVTGPWFFEAFYEGTLLYRVRFDLVAPDDAPNGLIGACDDVALTS